MSRSSAHLHVTTELVRISDDNVLWSETFDGEPSAIVGMQDTIVRAVSGALHLHGEGARSGPSARGTTDAEAYNLFLRGRHAFDAFDFPTASARFRDAVSRDPRFARALAFLAMSDATIPVLGIGSLDSALRVAQVSVDRALAIDSSVVEAYIAESFILVSDMRVGDGMKPLEKALSFDSTNADLLWSYGGGLGQVGDVDRALVVLQRARERDPLSVTATGLSAYAMYLARRHRDAIAMTREALALDPHAVLALRGLAFAYAFGGAPDSAAAAFEATFRADSMVVGGRSNLVFGYAVAGRWSDADRQRALINYANAGNSQNYYRTLVGLAYGDFDAAMAAFEQGVKDRDPLFSNVSLPCDPLFDPLKSNPRFAVVMRRIGAHAMPGRPLAHCAAPPRATLALQPHQIAVLHEEVVRCANERLEVEPVERIRRRVGLAPVAKEQHGSRTRLIREEPVAVQLRASRRERLLAVDEQRIERARLVAEIVVLDEIVLADDAQKDRSRELILGLHARNGVAADERVIGPPPIVLVDVRAGDAELIGRPQVHRERQIVDVGLRPLEEVLVLPADVRRGRAEARPLRRRQRGDVVAVGNAADADERNRVDLRADRSLDRVVRVQGLVPPERFPVHGARAVPTRRACSALVVT